MAIPYASATTSGENARKEITKVLRRFGCEEIGFMDNFNEHEVLLAFKHRGRTVQLKASAKGSAQMYLKQNPWSYGRRSPRTDWEQNALRQGHIAVNSILRDWMKGQVHCHRVRHPFIRGRVHAVHADGGRPSTDRTVG